MLACGFAACVLLPLWLCLGHRASWTGRRLRSAAAAVDRTRGSYQLLCVGHRDRRTHHWRLWRLVASRCHSGARVESRGPVCASVGRRGRTVQVHTGRGGQLGCGLHRGLYEIVGSKMPASPRTSTVPVVLDGACPPSTCCSVVYSLSIVRGKRRRYPARFPRFHYVALEPRFSAADGTRRFVGYPRERRRETRAGNDRCCGAHGATRDL